MKVVATGGLASLFRNTVGLFEMTDPDLTIRGLGLIFQRNAQARNAKPLK
jgi:pantothenate kinase type III